MTLLRDIDAAIGVKVRFAASRRQALGTLCGACQEALSSPHSLGADLLLDSLGLAVHRNYNCAVDGIL